MALQELTPDSSESENDNELCEPQDQALILNDTFNPVMTQTQDSTEEYDNDDTVENEVLPETLSDRPHSEPEPEQPQPQPDSNPKHAEVAVEACDQGLGEDDHVSECSDLYSDHDNENDSDSLSDDGWSTTATSGWGECPSVSDIPDLDYEQMFCRNEEEDPKKDDDDGFEGNRNYRLWLCHCYRCLAKPQPPSPQSPPSETRNKVRRID